MQPRTITTANVDPVADPIDDPAHDSVDGRPDLPVATAMLRTPKVCAADASAAEVRQCLEDDHVHAVLLVDGDQLVTIVERDDLHDVPAAAPARAVGRSDGRVTTPDAPLEATRLEMIATGRRRLAVVDDHGRLVGLLCLKRTGRGFCSAADVCARAEERRVASRPTDG